MAKFFMNSHHTKDRLLYFLLSIFFEDGKCIGTLVSGFVSFDPRSIQQQHTATEGHTLLKMINLRVSCALRFFLSALGVYPGSVEGCGHNTYRRQLLICRFIWLVHTRLTISE